VRNLSAMTAGSVLAVVGAAPRDAPGGARAAPREARADTPGRRAHEARPAAMALGVGRAAVAGRVTHRHGAPVARRAGETARATVRGIRRGVHGGPTAAAREAGHRGSVGQRLVRAGPGAADVEGAGVGVRGAGGAVRRRDLHAGRAAVARPCNARITDA